MSKLTPCSHSLTASAAPRRNCQVVYGFFVFICTSLHFLLIYSQVQLSHRSPDEIGVELTAPSSAELRKHVGVCFRFCLRRGTSLKWVTHAHLMAAVILRRKKRRKFLNWRVLPIEALQKKLGLTEMKSFSPVCSVNGGQKNLGTGSFPVFQTPY